MIVAKAIIPDQYWILRDESGKVGNIQVDNEGYRVKLRDNVAYFKTLTMLRERLPLDFDDSIKNITDDTPGVHGYPTRGEAHNAIWDVKRHLPLYTRDLRSRSWYAAGWYRVRQHRRWSTCFCPKVIMLDRYEFQGPFQTEQEARAR